MKRLPPFNALHSFLVTARQPSFTHAAEVLNRTQGSVSRQIAALEEYVGEPLFLRHARGLNLTEKGKQLVPLLDAIFKQLDDALEQVNAQQPALRLKVPTCAMRWFFSQLTPFQKAHPDSRIEVTTTFDHGADFSHSHYHAAILYGKPPENLCHHSLFAECLVPVCAPVMEGEPAAWQNVEQMADHCWLHPTPDQRDWQLWLKQQDLEAFQARRNQQFETMDLAIQAALQGYGIAMADRTLVQEEVAQGRLRIPFDRPVATGKGYYLVYPEGIQTQRDLIMLVEWLTETAAPAGLAS